MLSKYKKSIEKSKNLYFAIFILLFIILFVSPLGGFLRDPLRDAFSIAQYNTPLERTIAEQQQIGASIVQMTGGLGVKNEEFPNPIFSSIFNLFSQIFYGFLDKLGMNIAFVPKEPSWALTIITLSIILLTIKAIYLMIKRGDLSLFVLLLLIVFFVMGGSLKSKYGILFAYSFMISFGALLGELVLLPYSLSGIKFLSPYMKGKENLYSLAVFMLLLIPLLNMFFSSLQFTLLTFSGYVSYGNAPLQFSEVKSALCSQFKGEYCKDEKEFLSKIYSQFDANLCYASLAFQASKDYGQLNPTQSRAIATRCNVLPKKWLSAMDFIATTEKGSRITSWWDYGHWINYFGQRNAVIRNEHSYLYMILDVADAFIMGNETKLSKVMDKYDSKYVLIDDEIIMSGGTVFGSKFYALNYLACAKNNLTNIFKAQMQSKCEYDNLWETVVVLDQECTISKITGEKGKVVSRLEPIRQGEFYRQALSPPRYCLGKTKLSNGQEISALYYLNETTPQGDLKLNKGFLTPTSQQNTFVVIYNKDKVWIENGKVVDGWEDRKGRFYDSVVYKGYVLGSLEGFNKVFDNGGVKIYKKVS